MAMARHSPLGLFVLLAFLFSWGTWIPLLVPGISFESRLWKLTYVAGLSGPLLASALVSFGLGGWPAVRALLKRGCIWKVQGLWYVVALALPPLLMLAAWGMARLAGEAPSEWEMPPLRLLPLTFLIMTLRGGPLNEEFGWRGFFLPRLLERFSPFESSMLIAPVWIFWHVPLWFLPGVPHKYWPFGMFALLVFPINFLLTWLHCRTRKSVLLAILFHASFNTAIHYLPFLPPRHLSLVPFGMWAGLLWILTGIIIFKNPKAWFNRPPPKPEGSSPRVASDLVIMVK